MVWEGKQSWEGSCGNRNMRQLVTLYHCQEAELWLQGELGCKSLRTTCSDSLPPARLYFLKVSTILRNSTTSSGPSPWTHHFMCKLTPFMYITLPSSNGKPNWRSSQFHENLWSLESLREGSKTKCLLILHIWAWFSALKCWLTHAWNSSSRDWCLCLMSMGFCMCATLCIHSGTYIHMKQINMY